MKLAPGASRAEFHAPPSAVLVCDSPFAGSQLTHVTFVPGLILTVAGLKLKSRITTIVDQNASAGSVALQPSRVPDGPDDLSLKQAAPPINNTPTTAEAIEDDFIAPSPPPHPS